ncbi:MAG: HD domain-containing protein [Planctomycetaceae bacterium]
MTHPLLEIPELTRLESGGGLVRIPDQQDVPFSPRVRAVVDTPEFRRLANISQLGLVSRIYPGAMHTRFEHALGVFHNALRYLAQLARDPRFARVIDSHSAELLLCSALLHDLGHWPFAHPIEDLGLTGLPTHEQHASSFLQPGSELAEVLQREWGVTGAEVLDVLAGRTDTTPLRIVRSILSGPIDIDKMDYLERDSLHCGVPYGRHFDKQRLIQSLVLNAAGDGLALSSKGKTAAELMVFARYVMFSEVYWHHAVRSATCMFARAFHDLHGRTNLSALLRQTETELLGELRGLARGTAVEPLLEGVFGPRRKIFKRVLEATPHQHVELYERLSRQPYPFLVECSARFGRMLGRRLGLELSPCDLLIDAPPRHREIEFRVDIWFPKEEVYRPLDEVSPVVRALAGTQFDDYVKRVRLFATPHLTPVLTALPNLPTLLLAELNRAG